MTNIIWLALLILFAFLEAATVSVVSIWFALGALAAMLGSMLGAAIWLQIALFILVSAIFLVLLRPVARKYFTPKLQRTNADAVIGTVGEVTEEIDNVRSCGRVKLGAMSWSARSTTGQNIPAGTLVKADRIEGVKVFVTPAPVEETV